MNQFKEAISPDTSNRADIHSPVYLESSHVCISHEIAAQVFGNVSVILSVYYPAEKTFFLAPAGAEYFIRIHKTTQQILKTRNAAGDRSVAIHDLILDHGIDEDDRILNYSIEAALNVLKVTF